MLFFSSQIKKRRKILKYLYNINIRKKHTTFFQIPYPYLAPSLVVTTLCMIIPKKTLQYLFRCTNIDFYSTTTAHCLQYHHTHPQKKLRNTLLICNSTVLIWITVGVKVKNRVAAAANLVFLHRV